MTAEILFKNRSEAGKKLGRSLIRFKKENPLVIALPRGGVVVGAEVSKTLQAPLNILVVRKIGSPVNPEFGIGAATENGVVWINQNNLKLLGLNPSEVEELIRHEFKEIERKVLLFRQGLPQPQIKGRSIILIDDGMATGVTATVAAIWLKQNKAGKVIAAFPVCAPSIAPELKNRIDEFYCLFTPPTFYSVGQWYDDFNQVNDQEVLKILDHFRLKRHAA